MPEEQQQLGRYTLLEKIAQGGMAQVFKARTTDPNGFERLVVIKRILPHISEDPEYVEMLVDEAKIAVHFTHGNIAQIYDLGKVNDDYFIVMEFVDGKTLSQINKRLKQIDRPFPLDILLYCFIETCKGLSYVHKKKAPDGSHLGVVHRDISPQNVILSYAGNIKIIDFGVAKAKAKEGKTESGVLKGKFAYMSPEQARGDVIDHRSDIFSLGILLWELITGERLFKKKTNHETIKAIQKNKYVSLLGKRNDIPKELDKIIKKALNKKPKDRYQDANDVAIDLEKLLFKINPDFKTAYASEFVFRLFGPMEDEKSLPDQIYTKEKTPVTKISALDLQKEDENEEDTIKEEFNDNATPVVKIVSKKKVFYNQYLAWVVGILALFIFGTIYVYFANQNKDAYITIKKIDKSMTVFLNNKEIQKFIDIKVEPEEPHEIKVKKKNYHDFSVVVTLKPYEKKDIIAKLKKKKATAGSIMIITSPPGATVYIDNSEWGQRTPVTIRNLDAGRVYKIGLYLEKFQFHTQNAKIVSANNVRITHKFEMNFAYLSVTSNPLGAKVEIDGNFLGKTPFQSHNILPNRYIEILVQKEGYMPGESRIKLRPGEEKTLNFDLELLSDDDTI